MNTRKAMSCRIASAIDDIIILLKSYQNTSDTEENLNSTLHRAEQHLTAEKYSFLFMFMYGVRTRMPYVSFCMCSGFTTTRIYR